MFMDKIRILVADDHIVVRRGLVFVLQQEPDFEVVGEAQDGAMAVSMIFDTVPHVALLDWKMPRMDGLTLCRHLRGDEATATLPIIMLSGKAHHEAIQEGLNAGANRYMVKPTGLDELTRNITEVLAESNHTSVVPKDKIEA